MSTSFNRPIATFSDLHLKRMKSTGHRDTHKAATLELSSKNKALGMTNVLSQYYFSAPFFIRVLGLQWLSYRSCLLQHIPMIGSGPGNTQDLHVLTRTLVELEGAKVLIESRYNFVNICAGCHSNSWLSNLMRSDIFNLNSFLIVIVLYSIWRITRSIYCYAYNSQWCQSMLCSFSPDWHWDSR